MPEDTSTKPKTNLWRDIQLDSRNKRRRLGRFCIEVDEIPGCGPPPTSEEIFNQIIEQEERAYKFLREKIESGKL